MTLIRPRPLTVRSFIASFFTVRPTLCSCIDLDRDADTISNETVSELRWMGQE
jgi:hypothetical protein